MCPVELWFGTVQEFAKGKAKVVFPDHGNMPSPWLPVGFARTKDDVEYDPLAKGEPVACLMTDNGESGVVVCSIFNDACPPPADAENLWMRQFKDGTKLTYDRETKKFTAELKGDAEFKVTGNARLEATGTVDVTGSIVNLN